MFACSCTNLLSWINLCSHRNLCWILFIYDNYALIIFLKSFLTMLCEVARVCSFIKNGYVIVACDKTFYCPNHVDKSMWMAKGQRLLPIPVYIINDCGQASHCMPLSFAGVYNVVALLCRRVPSVLTRQVGFRLKFFLIMSEWWLNNRSYK